MLLFWLPSLGFYDKKRVLCLSLSGWSQLTTPCIFLTITSWLTLRVGHQVALLHYKKLASFQYLNVSHQNCFAENNSSYNFYTNPARIYDVCPGKLFDERLWALNIYTVIDSGFFFTVSTATIFCDRTTPSFEMSVYFCMFFQLAQFCPEILPLAAKETQATTHQGDSDTPAEQHVCACHILLKISLFHLKLRFYFFIFSLTWHSARVLG